MIRAKYFVVFSFLAVFLVGCTSTQTRVPSEKPEAMATAAATAQSERGNGRGQGQGQYNKRNCLADECLLVQDLDYPVATMSSTAQAALDTALNDEYKAYATYDKVIAKFGMVRPFSMVKRAEEQHIASLKALYDKYGLKVPENTWTAKVSAPATLPLACQVGVDAEIANAALYKKELLPQVSDYEDITLVFTNLMNASEQRHLPAFERCK